jgi:hypothetical protein
VGRFIAPVWCKKGALEKEKKRKKRKRSFLSLSFSSGSFRKVYKKTDKTREAGETGTERQ